jgi:hypothetical protein
VLRNRCMLLVSVGALVAIYLVCGKLGAGKSLACVGRIRDALQEGRRVVTNLDLKLEAMFPRGGDRGAVCRLPDKPTLEDLNAIGRGQEGCEDEDNGLIVLDELGAWLNTRSFQDKERLPVIEWLLHSRKLGWDVIMIIQHPNMVDKQVREGLCEYLVICRRTDRLPVPFLGSFVKLLTGKKLKMPQIHVGTVRYGMEPGALVADRWVYRARDLYAAYDTRQRFTSDRSVGLFAYVPSGVLNRFAKAQPKIDPLAPKPKLPHVKAAMRLPPDYRVKLLAFIAGLWEPVAV